MTTQTGWNSRNNTGKGELLGGDGTNPVVVPQGGDGNPLIGDSTAGPGVIFSPSFRIDDSAPNTFYTVDNPGGPLQMGVSNIGTTASTTASLSATVGFGGQAVQTLYQVTGPGSLGNWVTGNLATDGTYRISAGSLGTSDAFVAYRTGVISLPRQVAFTSRLAVSDVNVTGAGATYTFGQGGNLSTTQTGGTNLSAAGVFTVPVNGDGWYQFNGTISLSGVDAANDTGDTFFEVGAIGGPFLYLGDRGNFAVQRKAGSDTYAAAVSFVTFLVATNTVSLRCTVGGGPATVSVVGAAGTALGWSAFSGTKTA